MIVGGEITWDLRRRTATVLAICPQALGIRLLVIEDGKIGTVFVRAIDESGGEVFLKEKPALTQLAQAAK